MTPVMIAKDGMRGFVETFRDLEKGSCSRRDTKLVRGVCLFDPAGSEPVDVERHVATGRTLGGPREKA